MEELAVKAGKAAPACVGLGVVAEGPGEGRTGKDDDDDDDDATASGAMADACNVKLTGILEFLFNCCNASWFCLITA